MGHPPGSICYDADFYPYGGEITYTNTCTQNAYKFTGKERDSESGLDDFEARYYSSSLGRFMTPDWAARPTAIPYAVFGDPQSLNLYGYVRNDPVSRADADGHAQPPGEEGSNACSSNPQCAANKQEQEKAQNQSQTQTQQTQQQPKKGGGVLPTGTAAVDLGVGKAGVTVQGSAAAGAFVDSRAILRSGLKPAVLRMPTQASTQQRNHNRTKTRSCSEHFRALVAA